MILTARRCITLPGAVVLAAVLALSCGSSTAKSTDPIHSCNLITVQEIEKLIGAAVDQPPRETHRPAGTFQNEVAMAFLERGLFWGRASATGQFI